LALVVLAALQTTEARTVLTLFSLQLLLLAAVAVVVLAVRRLVLVAVLAVVVVHQAQPLAVQEPQTKGTLVAME
jgi:hypothetical protein